MVTFLSVLSGFPISLYRIRILMYLACILYVNVSKNVSIFLSLYPIMHQPTMQPTTIKIHQDTSRLQTPHRESETASATDRQICNIKFGILTDVPSTQPAQRVGRAAVPVWPRSGASGTSVLGLPAALPRVICAHELTCR